MKDTKYVDLIKSDKEEGVYWLWNKIHKEWIGYIKKNRVGQFMHWCLFPLPDTWFSNGCLKEISVFITSLYSKDKKKPPEPQNEPTTKDNSASSS